MPYLAFAYLISQNSGYNGSVSSTLGTGVFVSVQIGAKYKRYGLALTNAYTYNKSSSFNQSSYSWPITLDAIWSMQLRYRSNLDFILGVGYASAGLNSVSLTSGRVTKLGLEYKEHIRNSISIGFGIGTFIESTSATYARYMFTHRHLLNVSVNIKYHLI